MFIALDGPVEADEGIIVLIEVHTPTGVAPIFSVSHGCPPKDSKRGCYLQSLGT